MRVMIIDKTDVNDRTKREGFRKSSGLQGECTSGNSITPSKYHPYLWTVPCYVWARELNVITNYITY